ncbi:MAG: universal stress protein [bacterium]|nr:universal stress protein [bacterium]
MNTKTPLNSKIKRVLWTTDFSKESRYCLPYVKCFNESLKTKNHALYVLPKFSDWVYETAFMTDDELFATIERTRQKSLSRITNYSDRSGIPFKANIIEGLASDAIIRYSDEHNIDIIFTGRRGVSEIEQILVGSTTSRLIRNTRIPVFVVPKKKRDVSMEKILCPIDFNDFAMMELRYSISLAKQFKAKLYVAHVSEFYNYRLPIFKRDKLIDGINEKILGIAKELKYKIEELIYEEGEPAHKIIEIAKKNKMDVITMGTHQRTGIEKLFLGSITEKVLMYSNIPVIILPPPADE